MDERPPNTLEARVRALELWRARLETEREERERSQARTFSRRERLVAWTFGLVTVVATVGNFLFTLGGRP